MRDAGMKVQPGDVEKAGMRAVLRCPVGWSGDHRAVRAFPRASDIPAFRLIEIELMSGFIARRSRAYCIHRELEKVGRAALALDQT